MILRFDRLYRSLVHRLVAYQSHSETPIELCAIAQKAIWGTSIYSTIIGAQGSNDIYSPSLRDKLIQLNVTHKKYTFDPQIRAQCLKMFTTGIPWNQKIFSQDSFNFGSQKGGALTSQKVTIFCPNVLVTRPMFEYIADTSFNWMVTGNFGVGKSFASMLAYQCLTMVNTFVYRYSNTKQQRKLKHQLIKDGLISDSLPKLLYWNIRNSEFRKKIRQKYQSADIELRTMVDHINYLASLVGRQNQFVGGQYEKQVEKIQALLQGLKSEKTSDQYRYHQKKRQIFSYKKMLKNYNKEFQQMTSPTSQPQSIFRQISEFNKFSTTKKMYSSSVNIQQDLLDLDSHEPSKNKISLTISQRQNKIISQQINYSEDLAKEWGANEFWHFFWFQIERRFLLTNNKKVIDAAKHLFYSTCTSFEIKAYWRNLYISLFFKSKLLTQFKIAQNIEEPLFLKKAFQKMLEGYQQFCLNQAKTNFLQFANKKVTTLKDGEESKLRFIVLLHLLAKNQLKSKRDFIEFNAKTLDERMECKVSLLLLSSEHNQELVPLVYYPQTNIIRLNMSPQDFTDISEKIIRTMPYNYVNLLLPEAIRNQLKDNAQYRGNYAELSLRNAFQPSSKLTIPIKTKEDQREEMISINKIVDFYSCNSRHAGNRIEINFKEMVQNALQISNQSVLALPQYDNQKKFASTSRCFDFAIIKYSQEDQLISLNTFDVTLKEQSLTSKVNNFKQLMKELFKKENESVDKKIKQLFKKEIDERQKFTRFLNQNIALRLEWKHMFICHEDKCQYEQSLLQQETMILPSNLIDIRIRYSPYEKIQLQGGDELKNIGFDSTRKYILELREDEKFIKYF